MNTLHKVLDFEKEADDTIQKARKRASEILSSQGEAVKIIQRDFEGRIAKEKEALKTQSNQKISSFAKEEAQRRGAVLKKIKTDCSHNINKAVEIVLNHIVRS